MKAIRIPRLSNRHARQAAESVGKPSWLFDVLQPLPEMVKHGPVIALVPVLLIEGCTLQPAYQRPALAAPSAWNNGNDIPLSPPIGDRAGWWTLLGDPAIDRLVAAGLHENPTLQEAAARVDQARAALQIEDAAKRPAVGMEANAARSRDRLNPTGGTTGQTSAAFGVRLSWEIDLWGRVRESAMAAQSRLAARTVDAEGARLSVIGDIADATLSLRACHLTLEIRDRDIASRETELEMGQIRLAFGTIAPLAVAAAESNLAAARTARIGQEESCRLLVDALVALSGMEPALVLALTRESPTTSLYGLPDAPPFVPTLPATVLLANPAVVAAEREVAARWSDIAVARAERMPRIDLAAALTGQWVRALGSDSRYASHSIGAGLTAPLFDGGAGTATVRSAQAMYREAVARLALTVRATARDIEDALAAQQSAAGRVETSRAALAAAQFALMANEARWRAGAIAQFELEESRRQFNLADQGLIAAAADRARAWVALMRRTGRVQDTPTLSTEGSGG